MDLVEVADAGTAGVWVSVRPIGEGLLPVADIRWDWGEVIPILTAGSTPGSLVVGGRRVPARTLALPLASGPSAGLLGSRDPKTTSEQSDTRYIKRGVGRCVIVGCTTRPECPDGCG